MRFRLGVNLINLLLGAVLEVEEHTSVVLNKIKKILLSVSTAREDSNRGQDIVAFVLLSMLKKLIKMKLFGTLSVKNHPFKPNLLTFIDFIYRVVFFELQSLSSDDLSIHDIEIDVDERFQIYHVVLLKYGKALLEKVHTISELDTKFMKQIEQRINYFNNAQVVVEMIQQELNGEGKVDEDLFKDAGKAVQRDMRNILKVGKDCKNDIAMMLECCKANLLETLDDSKYHQGYGKHRTVSEIHARRFLSTALRADLEKQL